MAYRLLTLLALAPLAFAQALPQGVLSISGKVHAPPGASVAGTLVVACFVVGDGCDEGKSAVVELAEDAESASFSLPVSSRDAFMLFASRDADGDGQHFGDGDWYALFGTDGMVTPPALGLELRLEVLGAAPAEPGSGTLDNRPGTVTGLVLDTQGRPIAGAKVWIEPALTTGLVELRTGPDGRYEATSLPDVPYRAKAWTEVEYLGQRYCLRLALQNASDYDSFVPSHGVVRDFRWQLTGPIEDLRDLDGYFGAQLRVMNAGYYQDAAAIEFSFAPTGLLLDGSSSEPFSRRLELSRRGTDLFDIPVGPYRVSAALIGQDGSRQPLPIGPDIFDTEHAELDVFWESAGSCSNGNGVDWAYVWLDNPYE